MKSVEGKMGSLEDKMESMERRLKLRMEKERNKIMLAIGNLATHTPTVTAFRELKQKVEQPFAS